MSPFDPTTGEQSKGTGGLPELKRLRVKRCIESGEIECPNDDCPRPNLRPDIIEDENGIPQDRAECRTCGSVVTGIPERCD